MGKCDERADDIKETSLAGIMVKSLGKLTVGYVTLSNLKPQAEKCFSKLLPFLSKKE